MGQTDFMRYLDIFHLIKPVVLYVFGIILDYEALFDNGTRALHDFI